MRISKTVNGVKYTYAYINGLLMYETRGDAKFYYSYDANGTLYSVKYTLTDSSNLLTYYYTHNSRGDIVGIYNGAGQLRAHYEYDAWGNMLSVTDQNGNAITSSTHIGNLNPFRYRGYYLDTETGLYYLMSRYYDPVTHRFVNADGYFQSGSDILDTNMSAYCRNNPINYADPTGKVTINQLQEELASGNQCVFDITLISELQRLGYSANDEIECLSLDVSQTVDVIGSNAIDSGAGYLKTFVSFNTPYFLKEISYNFSQASKILLIHQLASEVSTDFVSGNRPDKIAYDVAADVLCTGSPVAFSLILGTSIGGPPGVIAGFVVGSIITLFADCISYNGQTGREHLKSWYK